MSVDASIDISFSENSIDILLTTINILIKNGWSLINQNGKICYLPLGDDDMFNWQSDLTNIEDLISIISNKMERNELVGICMYWQNPIVGIDLLFNEDSSLSICLNDNRRKLNRDDHRAITDVNWYLERILVPLRNGKLPIEAFSFCELQ